MEVKQENNYGWRRNNNQITEQSNTNFIFDSCCFCIPLRTGCLILGYIQLVVLIVSTYLAALGIAMAGTTVALVHEQQMRDQYTQRNVEVAVTVLLVVSVATLMVALITLPFTILLLVGLHKERRNYVKIYLVYAVVMAVLHLIATIGQASMGQSSGTEIARAFISILLNIYFLLVLRSHYIKMGQSANNLPPQQHREGQLMQKAYPPAQPLYCPQGTAEAETLNKAVQPSCPPKYEDCV